MSINKTTSRTLYIKTASLPQNAADEDQLNKFKIDLSSDPIQVANDERIRVNITNFQMEKNFIDINGTNHGFRLFIAGSSAFTDTDETFFLPTTQALTKSQLAAYFQERVLSTITSKYIGSGTLSVTADANPELSFVCGDTSNDGLRLPVATTNLGNTTLDFTISQTPDPVTLNSGTFIIQCLYLDAAQQALANASSMTIVSQDHLFNDSYVLFGAARVTEFEDPPITESFRINRTATTIRIRSHYPMNNHVNTVPDVYVKLLQSTGINTVDTVLCKIPRVIDSQQNTQYILENNDIYHELSTDALVEDIVLSVRDHNDRILPIFPSTLTNFGGQAKNGNASCNFILNIDKVKTRGINHI